MSHDHSVSRDEKVPVLRIFSRLNVGGPSIHVVLLTAGLDSARYDTTLVIGREGEREGSFMEYARGHGVSPRSPRARPSSCTPFTGRYSRDTSVTPAPGYTGSSSGYSRAGPTS